MLDFLRTHPACTGKLGTAGFCIGGHLCLRAAMVGYYFTFICHLKLGFNSTSNSNLKMLYTFIIKS